MKVGILGSGDVATTLGRGFLFHGHAVLLGTRNPATLAQWKAQTPKGRVGSFAEAAAFGDIVVVAIKGSAAADALRAAGAQALEGKTVIDATNPVADTPPDNGVLRFFTSLDESLMERLQREFAQARFVKAFSCVGAARMVNPVYSGTLPTMFICGNDAAAKKTVAGILVEFGWDVADMGGVEAARAIEPLCMLWCLHGFANREWTHAFKLLRQP